MLHSVGFAEMSGRLWYPQLDVYDCVRRIGALLLAFGAPPGVERLSIIDFYLANPPLLHRSKMTKDTRRLFTALKIPRPEKTFLTYPAPPLLFNKMEPIQKEALRAMAGKSLLSINELQRGVAKLTERGQAAFRTAPIAKLAAGEMELIRFLTEDFAPTAEAGTLELRKSTGLRRVR